METEVLSLYLCNPCFFIYHAVVQDQKPFPTCLDTNRTVHYSTYILLHVNAALTNKTALRVLSFDLLKIIVLLVFKLKNEVMPEFCL